MMCVDKYEATSGKAGARVDRDRSYFLSSLGVHSSVQNPYCLKAQLNQRKKEKREKKLKLKYTRENRVIIQIEYDTLKTQKSLRQESRCS